MNTITENAIIDSIERETIVHLDYAPDVALDLAVECTDSVVNDDVEEFWGVAYGAYNEVWHNWRVHLYWVPRGDRRRD